MVSRTSQGSGTVLDAMERASDDMTKRMAATAGPSPYPQTKENYMSDRLKGNSN